MAKIAVIQTAFPGDVILASPMFEALKRRSPESETAAVVRPECSILLENNPFIDNVIVYDKYGADKGIKGMMRIARKLRGCDEIYIVQRHLRAAITGYLSRARVRAGYAEAAGSALYTRKVKYREDLHEVERCLSLLGPDVGKFRPRLFPGDDNFAKADEILHSFAVGDNFAVVAPGSIWPTKLYPYYPGLIHLVKKELNLPVVLLGGNKDIKLSEAIVRDSLSAPYNLAGMTDLLTSAAIIAKAKIVIANDSAPSHMAAAVDTPVVSIFGPTVPRFGFTPYSEKSKVVEIEGLYCRPCGRHGSRKCPQKHFRCMLELQPSRIIEAARSLLA